MNCITSNQIASVSGSAVTGAIPVASVPAGNVNTYFCKTELFDMGPDPKRPDRFVDVLVNPCTKVVKLQPVNFYWRTN